jgi:NarL family two-component system response regulator LiaR
MTPIRVALVDDHPVITDGLKRLLSDYDDLDVVGTAGGGSAGIALCAELHPDVVLMDLSMPEIDGVEATRRVIAANPAIRVIALTGFLDEETLRGVFDAGASGYLLKTVSGDDLAEAVRAVSKGLASLSLEVLSKLHLAHSPDDGHAASLTARELDVLRCLAEGATNKSIAHELSLSPGTIRVYVSSILAKLGVENRTAAARYAIRHDLVSATESTS